MLHLFSRHHCILFVRNSVVILQNISERSKGKEREKRTTSAMSMPHGINIDIACSFSRKRKKIIIQKVPDKS
tara:strand:+ start:645 stop:860 length:216 start_codon:yes stop_codon:yes gene_type:complete